MQVSRGEVVGRAGGEGEARDGGGEGGEGGHGWGGGNGVAFWREREPQKLIREKINKDIGCWCYFPHICGSSTTADVELEEGSGSRLLFKSVVLFFLFSKSIMFLFIYIIIISNDLHLSNLN